MRNALHTAFEDEVEKERLLTYVRLLCSYILSLLTMFSDSVRQGRSTQYLHRQSPPPCVDQLWSDGKENRHRGEGGMAASQDSVRVWGY